MNQEHSFRASPNLALAKYWGKADIEMNLPATPSMGITLDGLDTITTARISDETDIISINGLPAEMSRFSRMLDALRSRLGRKIYFSAESKNSFPTAAGLASSSSGIAALTYSCAEAADLRLERKDLSDIARLGSASAARAVFGGFVCLEACERQAYQLRPAAHWPDLRVLVVSVDAREKTISSRRAMEVSRISSPYFERWVDSSSVLFSEIVSAVNERDIEKLGAASRQSYLRMFGTMFSSAPPIIYWQPDSLRIIHECALLRAEGCQAWETMDAGPQVKIICLESEIEYIHNRICSLNDTWKVFFGKPGQAPSRVIGRADD